MPTAHQYDTENHENGQQVRATCICGWKGSWRLYNRPGWDDVVFRDWNEHTEKPSTE